MSKSKRDRRKKGSTGGAHRKTPSGGGQAGKRAAAGKTRQTSRVATYVLIAGGAVLAAGYFLRPALFPALPEPVPGTVIDVTADMGGFSEKVIQVRAGEPITIRLTSLDGPNHLDGGGKHQFAIDELGVDIVAPSRGSASQTFTPTEPGTYVFYCDICCGGRANPTMSGRLVVKA